MLKAMEKDPSRRYAGAAGWPRTCGGSWTTADRGAAGVRARRLLRRVRRNPYRSAWASPSAPPCSPSPCSAGRAQSTSAASRAEAERTERSASAPRPTGGDATGAAPGGAHHAGRSAPPATAVPTAGCASAPISSPTCIDSRRTRAGAGRAHYLMGRLQRAILDEPRPALPGSPSRATGPPRCAVQRAVCVRPRAGGACGTRSSPGSRPRRPPGRRLADVEALDPGL